MDPLATIRNVWRKNAPELIGLFDGSLPDFVVARTPAPLPGVPVFCYHLVEPDIFRADLSFLRTNGYHTLSGAEFLAHMEGRQAIPERSVLLTFDDGPRNFHEVAFPLLREFRARAMAFIAPGLHADRDETIDNRPMDWGQIEEIHASGLVEFQSHTFESRFVPRWPRPAALVACEPALEVARRLPTALELRDDLTRSREALAARLPGAEIVHLSFPQYFGTAEAVETAKAVGFRACYWGYLPNRPLNRPEDSPFFISRVGDEFVRRLPGNGRISMREMLAERVRRIQAGRAWRRRFPDPVDAVPPPAQGRHVA
jgi:peptidoglycan/xylan/chitin deacetylase (PgdA/CDA1 family)